MLLSPNLKLPPLKFDILEIIKLTSLKHLSMYDLLIFPFRFIGELFKLKMLTENIMHDCVFKLLRTKDPENLECLCRLLTTIGKELDTDKAKVRLAYL